MNKIRGSLAVWVWLFTSVPALPESESPAPNPGPDRIDTAACTSLEFETADGSRSKPFLGAEKSVRVFVFVSNECPIANRYAPEFRRLHTAFRDRPVRFWFVHSFADETRAEIAKHAKEYSLPATVLRDPERRLARLLGATVTPEAVVVDRDGKLAYRGRIDDRFAWFGRERARATRADLKEALEAVLAGRAVEVPRTRAIGCTIPTSP